MSDQVKSESAVSGCSDIPPIAVSAEPAQAVAKRKNGRETHGYNRVKAVLAEVGTRRKSLYKRNTAEGRLRAAQRQEFIDALGGESDVSPQRLRIIDTTVRTAMLLDYVDGYIAEIGSKIINRRHKRLAYIVQQRQSLADSLLKHLQALGLDRRTRRVEDVADYMARKASEAAP